MKDWKYSTYLGILAGVLLLAILSREKKFDWRVTLAHDDKNPFGAYALSTVLSDEQKIEHRYKTFYELKDSLPREAGVFILAESFRATKEETGAMLDYVNGGGVIFISAHSIIGKLADTVQVRTEDDFLRVAEQTSRTDSAFIRLRNTAMDTTTEYSFRSTNIFDYLDVGDTTTAHAFPTTVVASNNKNHAVAVKVTVGKGYIVFNSTPLIFTNYELLRANNHRLVSSLLSYLPHPTIYWTEYYQSGRGEPNSPLRFVLSSEPLRWAYYITVVSMIIFIVFEAKRRQRLIPVIKPLPNTTVNFVNTIGALYFENADHKSIAMKKVHFFQETVRTRYYFSLPVHSPQYVQALSAKAGVDEEIVRQLSAAIRSVLSQATISTSELKSLHRHIRNFWAK